MDIIKYTSHCLLFYLHHSNIVVKEKYNYHEHQLLEIKMCEIRDSMSTNGWDFLLSIHKNFVEQKKIAINIEKFIELTLNNFIKKKLLSKFRIEQFKDLFNNVFHETCSAYIYELKRNSSTFYYYNNEFMKYKKECLSLIEEKLQHFLSVDIHKIFDPDINTVPYSYYQELNNKYIKELERANKYKKLYIELKEKLDE